MFKFKFPEKKDTNESMYEGEVMSLLEALSVTTSGTDEYDKLLDELNSLMDAKSKQVRKGPDPNTILTVAGTVLLGVLMLNYEKADVITSKVLGLLGKIRA